MDSNLIGKFYKTKEEILAHMIDVSSRCLDITNNPNMKEFFSGRVSALQELKEALVILDNYKKENER